MSGHRKVSLKIVSNSNLYSRWVNIAIATLKLSLNGVSTRRGNLVMTGNPLLPKPLWENVPSV